MDNIPKDNLKVLVVGFGPYRSYANIGILNSEYSKYKDSTAAAIRRCGYNVINTTDITVSKEGQSLVDARRWISRNSLRKYDGEKVKVICTIDAQTTINPSWVDIMCLIFERKNPSLVAAVMESKAIPSNKHLKKFFPSLDITVVLEAANDNCGDILPLLNRSLNIVLETTSMDGRGCMPHLKCIIDDLEPFEIKARSCIAERDMRAWSNEKVILFGRTGSGKSTIAQMLTRGHLNAPAGSDIISPSSPSRFKASPTLSSSGSTKSWSRTSSSAPGSPIRTFEASSNARGMTKDIQRGEGRGWHVTDTPGFGETREGCTVSTEEATKIVKQFVIDICGIYSHYLYVVKKDRMNRYDETLWKFFNKVFADAEANFTVVVTGCDMELSDNDKKHLQSTFPGCNSFYYVDFPPVSKDSEIEEENEEVRKLALEELETGLACLGVADRMTSEGEYSSESLRFVKSNIRANISGFSSKGAVLDDMIVHLYNSLVVRPISGVAGIFHKSKIDENFILLPQ
jgi:GTP-binding protein EngB required for normal cell division